MKILVDVEVQKTDTGVNLVFPNGQQVTLTTEEFETMNMAPKPFVQITQPGKNTLAQALHPVVTIRGG